ncbi:hypothetical protein Aperf_G00000039660 [Anoplocephala perfoliata]
MTNTPFIANRDEEVPMPTSLEDQDLGSVENHKSIIMHIISQLTEGKDLTKVVLPTFILERRSLLELFADYVAHPQLLIDVTNGVTPHERMKNFVKWYLTAFHAGRKDKVAKKPYNPIIGEVFQCSWRLSTPSTTSETSTASETLKEPEISGVEGGDLESKTNKDIPTTGAEPTLITFCGEQVSHHPPISAFEVSCPKRRLQLVGGVHTMSHFRGISIYVTFVGKVVLKLGEHDEDYVFTLPTAYGRSILTVPWFEIYDTVTVECPQTGYSAIIKFFAKLAPHVISSVPDLNIVVRTVTSKHLHEISAEVFSPATSDTPKKVVVSVTGHWNSTMHFVDHVSETTEVIDTSKLEIEPKWVRPISLQEPEESQKLWFNVSTALKQDDLNLATQEKTKLEDIQRVSEQARIEKNLPHIPKFFMETPDGYVFIEPKNGAEK